MTPEIQKSDNSVTPWLLKWIFLPLFGGALIIAFGGFQINSWKCEKTRIKNEVICRESSIRDLVPLQLTPYDEAVQKALIGS